MRREVACSWRRRLAVIVCVICVIYNIPFLYHGGGGRRRRRRRRDLRRRGTCCAWPAFFSQFA